MWKIKVEMAQENQGQSIFGKGKSVSKVLHQGNIWNTPETAMAAYSEKTISYFKGVIAQGSKSAEAPASPKAIVCPRAWHLPLQ